MAVQGVARRYAEAIFDLSGTVESQNRWLDALRTLAEVERHPDGRAFFENPAVGDRAKLGALDRLLPGDENVEPRNLARLLIHRQRFIQISGILEAFEQLVLASRGVVVANVTTAVSLTSDEQARVQTELHRIVGSEVDVRPFVDQSILGGIVARIGDRLIDGSVRSQLRELRVTLGRG